MNTVTTPPLAEHTTTLYFRQGPSDKVYQAAVKPKGEGFVVNFAYGRRDTTLQAGTKTATPVDYDRAKEIYDKLVQEKMAKGYTPGEDGTPYQQTSNEDRVTGILPQLLNPIQEDELNRFLEDPRWCAQEKYDGRRVLVRKTGDQVIGLNRKGLVIALPEKVARAAKSIPGQFILDGECIGDVLFVFDVLQIANLDLRQESYQKRLVALMNLLGLAMQWAIQLADTAFAPAQKRDLCQRLRREDREGIVFKRLDAPYAPGRPASGGPALKHKFYATLSAVVSKVNAQRSVEVRLLNCKGWIPVGNVAIPPNHPVPAVAEVVEVRYLYAFPESKALYQPIYLGQRKDVEPHECIMAQLKFKPGGEEEENQ